MRATRRYKTQRGDARAREMYVLYCSGRSLAQVAAAYGVARQSVYKAFALRGLVLRPRPTPLPHTVFNGARYTRRNTGYWGRTNGGRTLLHRDVWEYYHGPIPLGWDVHHLDGNRANDAIANLELLPKPEHTRRYSPHNNQYTKGRRRCESSTSAQA